MFQQLLLAVDYCHRLGVANRDIKLDNILVSGSKNPTVIKVSDLGFRKGDMDSTAKTPAGTAMYMGMQTIYLLA